MYSTALYVEEQSRLLSALYERCCFPEATDRSTDHPSARIKFASRERCKFSPRKDSRRTSTTLRHARVTQKSHTKCSEENKVDYASRIFSPLKNWSLFRTRSNVVSLRRTSSNREAGSLRLLGIGVNVIGGDSFCPSFLHASYFPSTPFLSLTAPLPVPLGSFVVSQRSYISLLPRLLFLPLSYQLARNARRYVAAYSLTVYLQPWAFVFAQAPRHYRAAYPHRLRPSRPASAREANYHRDAGSPLFI